MADPFGCRNPLAEVLDTFFNGRPAPQDVSPPPSPKKRNMVTVAELIRRQTSVILYDGKLYRVKVKEVETTR
jgi:hypothetical protein